MNLWRELSPGPDWPKVIYVVVEIPKGSRNKYEYDESGGFVKLDRVLFSSLHYPGDYGFVPQTLHTDGDPLDVLVMTNEPTFSGCVIEARPLGVYGLIDKEQIDDNILFAAEGLERSRQRARLDKQFRSAIDNPERLSDVAVAEATTRLLAQARTITPRGPLLEQQIATLDTLLTRANTPVSVTFRSDAETEVIIYKVARLGRFEQRELTLRPGTYTVRGSRNGYRDVLESITITHEGAPAPITIACTEPIN